MFSNSMTTTRCGVRLPSLTSVAPPRTRYLPPWAWVTAGISLIVLVEQGLVSNLIVNNHVCCHARNFSQYLTDFTARDTHKAPDKP